MFSLDDTAALSALDPKNVLGSVDGLADQCEQAWNDGLALSFPGEYRQVQNIVFSGMGGSALGAYVVKSLFENKLAVPFEIVNDYTLPSYVGPQTLVLLASYSGTTEETLSCATDGLQRKAKVTGLTTGGTLAKLFEDAGVPFYLIRPTHNPSGQPRLGTGYSVFGQIAILSQLGMLSLAAQDASETFAALSKGKGSLGVSRPESSNPSKKLARSWTGKIPVIVAAEHLGHVGRVLRNQLHESAKSYADYHLLPELNHHLMEGLANPASNKETLSFLFLLSHLYTPKIQKRMTVTMDVVQKQGIAVETYTAGSTGALSQALECIQFGAYSNYYLAMIYGLDPSNIPWVDYFKKQISQG